MSTRIRSPLTPVSPNADVVESSRAAMRESLRRTDLPGFGWYGQAERLVRSPFVPELPAEDKSNDKFWIGFYSSFGERSWPLDDWVRTVRKLAIGRVFDENFTFDGSENYRSDVPLGVTYTEMTCLLNGRNADVELFLRAEGLLMRLIVVLLDHPSRVAVFKTWLVIVGRVMGGIPVSRLDGALNAVENLGSIFSGCTPSGTFLTSFQRHAGEQVRKQQVWLYAVKMMSTVRDHHWGPFGYDDEMCCVHFRSCIDAMEAAKLDWDDTTPNTPEHRELDDEESELLENQRAADFHGGRWPYRGFTDEDSDCE